MEKLSCNTRDECRKQETNRWWGFSPLMAIVFFRTAFLHFLVTWFTLWVDEKSESLDLINYSVLLSRLRGSQEAKWWSREPNTFLLKLFHLRLMGQNFTFLVAELLGWLEGWLFPSHGDRGWGQCSFKKKKKKKAEMTNRNREKYSLNSTDGMPW